MGTVFLEYAEEYAIADTSRGERWLPCPDCDGAGEIPRSVYSARQFNKLMGQLLECLVELLASLRL
jgi:hypothetical protein